MRRKIELPARPRKWGPTPSDGGFSTAWPWGALILFVIVVGVYLIAG